MLSYMYKKCSNDFKLYEDYSYDKIFGSFGGYNFKNYMADSAVWSLVSGSEGEHPFDTICRDLKINSFKLCGFAIPDAPRKFKKFQRKWSGEARLKELMKHAVLELAGSDVLSCKLYEIGAYSYVFGG